MLTPQDIQNKEFAKAVFGGYDMASVDDFLEQLTEDYSALYKDNQLLKGKLKVLVEKVEEYRSTEDAMRMALLTAQKMSDDMTAETRKKCDEMLAEAARASDEARAKALEDITHEDMKLEAAKIKTSSFVQASRQIIDQYASFLDKLDTVTADYGGARDAVPEPESAPEPVFSPEPERVRMPVKAEEPAAKPAPEPAPEEEKLPEPPEGVDTTLEPAPQSAPADVEATRRIDIDAVRRIYSASGETKRIWDEEDELTTPRPKFDFSDLRFGANYADEENPKGGKKDKS